MTKLTVLEDKLKIDFKIEDELKMKTNPNMKLNPKMKRNTKIKMTSIEKVNKLRLELCQAHLNISYYTLIHCLDVNEDSPKNEDNT